MTKYQIKQELRRSACEDSLPWKGVAEDAYEEAVKFLSKSEWKWSLWKDVSVEQNFFLLVAEAL